jgi:heme-degrading monooxygenase HmoA
VILEVADIRSLPGRQAAFDEAIHRGIEAVIAMARGLRGDKVNKRIEAPECQLLMIFWDTLESHRASSAARPRFAQWRAIVGLFFARPPQVEHCMLLAKSHTQRCTDPVL